MKNILLIFGLIIFFSCSSGNENENTETDSMNAIEDRPLPDTTIAPFPDGYAPPNADIDTSQRVKDSIKNAQQ